MRYMVQWWRYLVVTLTTRPSSSFRFSVTTPDLTSFVANEKAKCPEATERCTYFNSSTNTCGGGWHQAPRGKHNMETIRKQQPVWWCRSVHYPLKFRLVAEAAAAKLL